jgi:hypothetical protein
MRSFGDIFLCLVNHLVSQLLLGRLLVVYLGLVAFGLYPLNEYRVTLELCACEKAFSEEHIKTAGTGQVIAAWRAGHSFGVADRPRPVLTPAVADRIICAKDTLLLEQIKWPKRRRAGKSGLPVSLTR